MHQFNVTILGSGAALPARGRYPSAQVLNANGSLYLIDCAEGTQMRLRDLGVSIQKINTIFISHLHGDHYLGLLGLISTMHLLGREKELIIFGPIGLKEIVNVQLGHSNTYLRFSLIIIELKVGRDQVFEDKNLYVECLPLKHRIDCHGYLFHEKERERNVIKDQIVKHDLSIQNIRDLKLGSDVISASGKKVKCEEVTTEALAPRRYAYCSDTAYIPELATVLEGFNMIYHEATFADDLQKRAKETYHSTARQAGMLARQAGVKKLLIGHFSSRYKDLSVLLDQACEEFQNTELAQEGEVYNIN